MLLPRILPFLLGVCIFNSSAHAMSRHKLVHVEQGQLSGSAEGSTWVFKGIPFAAPPVGTLRWRAPEPGAPWQGIREASNEGPECIQPKTQTDHPKSEGSEDCLTLNLWAPAQAETSPVPVMVFVHGGFFAAGDKDESFAGFHLFNGTSIAEKGGVIVITINYRLEVMGFMAHSALTSESGNGDSGNYGLLDQLQALRWIKQNIAAFGGDPDRVTVFGESAGAASVLALSASPLGAGLFRYAIAESGYLTKPTRSEAESLGAKVAHNTGCDQSPDVLACLRALPASQVISSISNSQIDGQSDPFLPNTGGSVLPLPVAQAFADGKINPSSILIGSNSQESSVLVGALYGKKVRNDTELSQIVSRIAGPSFWSTVSPLYNSARFGTAEKALIGLSTDTVFTCPELKLLRGVAASRKAHVWRYIFSHTSHSAVLKSYGAGHGLEMPYVFHYMPRLPIIGFTAAEVSLSDAIIQHWTRFAATGDPGWPEFSQDDGETYQDLDVREETLQGFRSTECATINP